MGDQTLAENLGKSLSLSLSLSLSVLVLNPTMALAPG
jgi:hypothetical protein